MRILHISGDSGVGGVESLLVTLARHSGVDPSTSHDYSFTTQGPAIDLIRQTGSRAVYVGTASYHHARELFATRRRMAALLRDNRYDVAVIHQYTYLIAAFSDLLLRHRVRIARYLHNELDNSYWLEKLVRFVYGPRIAQSLSNSRFLLEATPTAKGVVAYCPVERRICLPEGERRRVRVEFQTNPDEPLVVQVCRMAERKGHMRLLRALATLRHLRWNCWIVGGPQTEEEVGYFVRLTGLARELGMEERVRFLGLRTNVPEILASADVFCHPNAHPPEPFGIAFVEALQAGLPVVTSGMGGVLEIVSDQCGFLVPPNDETALADALKTLLTDDVLRNRMSQAARLRGERFTAGIQVPLLNKAIHGALSRA